ncbi:MAG: hypothetical protein WCG25_04375 [bacterium]
MDTKSFKLNVCLCIFSRVSLNLLLTLFISSCGCHDISIFFCRLSIFTVSRKFNNLFNFLSAVSTKNNDIIYDIIQNINMR